MDRLSKTAYILAFTGLTVGILCIRSQSPMIALTILITFGIIFVRPWAGLPTTALQLVLLYPGANTGYLYGRDSVGLSAIARDISHNGWGLPQQVEFVWGDPTTPIIHFLIAVGSKVTGLRIFPSVDGDPLFTTLVPIIAVCLTLLLIGLLIRHHISTTDIPIAILPALLWIPLFQFYTGTRRGALSIVFVTFLLFIILRIRTDGRVLFAALPLLLVLPATHHLGMAFALLLIACLGATIVRIRRLTLVAGVLASLWFAWITTRAVFAVVFGISLLSLGSSGPDIIANTESSFLDVLGPLLTQSILVLLAVLFTLVLTWEWRNGILNPVDLGLYFYSGFIGIITAIMYVGGGLAWTRAATFFVVVAGWLPIARAHQLLPSRNRLTQIASTGLICLLVLTAGIQVEPHIVSSQEPEYDNGVVDQRFHAETFAAGYWARDHATGMLVGDANTMEVTVATSQKEGTMAADKLLNSGFGSNYIVIVSGRNEHLVMSLVNGEWYLITPDKSLETTYQQKTSKVYTNSWIDGYRKLDE
ncbi:hypothetical protein [Natrinema gari]|uniref:hypothetical protein n=1 Tax=Natrinema gari TaxID=419186 RepID=UPI0012687E08|nr:hypothetical protein [Natrinema gari]